MTICSRWPGSCGRARMPKRASAHSSKSAGRAGPAGKRLAPRERAQGQMPYGTAMIVAGALFISALGSALAAEPSGAREYKDNCARCHGLDAKGNGPDANEKAGYHPADLTQITRRHGDKFPRQTIYDIIDGGKRLPGHHD